MSAGAKIYNNYSLGNISSLESAKISNSYPLENKAPLGLSDISNIYRLQNNPIPLPSLGQLAQKNIGSWETYSSLPVSRFPEDIKIKLPQEIIFARMANEAVDWPVYLSASSMGQPIQEINVISGKKINLVLKPEEKVNSIKGYLLYKGKQESGIFDSLSRLFSFLPRAIIDPVSASEEMKNVETRLKLAEFEFTDPDGDGIYEASVDAPIPEGEYELVTIINYANPAMGSKELRLITVVDPEGYIFRKMEGQESRIKNAEVSLFYFNERINDFDLWPADKYQQENPQTTDVTGKYSFLAPAGKYQLRVETPGYKKYSGKEFIIANGEGIHQNIELEKKISLSALLDWRNIILLLVVVLLAINFWRDRRRDLAIK